MLRNQKGFTLIELLIVVVIIGILAAIALPKFSAARERAYFSAMKSDLKSLASSQEVYYSKNLQYSGDAVELGVSTTAGGTYAGSKDVTVTFAVLNDDNGGINQAFTGGSVHAALGAAGCAIFGGDLAAGHTANGATATQPGVPVCNEL